MSAVEYNKKAVLAITEKVIAAIQSARDTTPCTDGELMLALGAVVHATVFQSGQRSPLGPDVMFRQFDLMLIETWQQWRMEHAGTVVRATAPTQLATQDEARVTLRIGSKVGDWTYCGWVKADTESAKPRPAFSFDELKQQALRSDHGEERKLVEREDGSGVNCFYRELSEEGAQS